MKKKLSIILLLISSFFILCGCADINFSREFDDKTGEIIDEFSISVNKDLLSSEKLNQLDTQIKEDFNNYILKIALIDGVTINSKTENYNYTLTTSFKNVDLMLAIYNNYDIGPFSFYIKNQKQTWISPYSPFLYLYKPDTDKSLISAIKYRLAFDDTKTFYQNYYQMLMGEEIDINDLQLDNLNITQSFTTNYDRIYSNASAVEVKDGKITHTWDLTNKDESFNLIIYKLIARTSGWYIVALVLTILLIVVLTIIIKIKKKPVNKSVNLYKNNRTNDNQNKE